MKKDHIGKALLFGIAIGDALGVPVEFITRKEISKNPVTDMIGYGTHEQPRGTFSDDSSLTFCLAEALTHGFDLNTIAENFVNWYDNNYWTAGGEVFDIGIATEDAIIRLKNNVTPELAGGFEEDSNGNGSLMRILPLLIYVKNKTAEERYRIIKQVSSITHGHARSVISCFYYIEFALQLIQGRDKFEAYKNLQNNLPVIFGKLGVNPLELIHFDRLLKENITERIVDEICSTGYVLHTLEASIWCILTTNDYSEAVLKAVNLGEDTDTTGAVTGGLAGLVYGFEGIPKRWINELAKKSEIYDLANRMEKCGSS